MMMVRVLCNQIPPNVLCLCVRLLSPRQKLGQICPPDRTFLMGAAYWGSGDVSGLADVSREAFLLGVLNPPELALSTVPKFCLMVVRKAWDIFTNSSVAKISSGAWEQNKLLRLRNLGILIHSSALREFKLFFDLKRNKVDFFFSNETNGSSSC